MEIDDRWHFTVKKRKLWLWIASGRLEQEVMAYTVGDGSKKAWNRLLGGLNGHRMTQMATDGFKRYKQIVSVEKYKDEQSG